MTERKDYLGILMNILVKSPQLPSNLRKQIAVLKEERKREIEESKTGKEVSLAVKVPDFITEGLEEIRENKEDGKL